MTHLSRFAANEAGQHQGALSDETRLDTDKLSVEKGNLHQEASNVLNLWVLVMDAIGVNT